MKRIFLIFIGMLCLISCEYQDNGVTTINEEITSDYLLTGNLDTYIQNNQIVRLTGKPGISTITVGSADLSKYEPCFILHVESGTNPGTMVSSAIVTLDGMVVLNTSDFSKNDGRFQFEVCNLVQTSSLSVEVRGEPGSYVNVWIEGKITSEVDEFYDLNDNQVPLGWEFIVLTPEVILQSGKLVALTVDAQGSLRRYVNIPTSISRMEMEWDGNLAPAYWGMASHLQFILDDNSTMELLIQTALAWGGNNNKLFLYHYKGEYGDSYNMDRLGEWLVPLKYGDFHYKAAIDNDQLHIIGFDLLNGEIYFDQIIDIPSSVMFSLQRIKSVNYTVNSTTDNNNWMDNIRFRLFEN